MLWLIIKSIHLFAAISWYCGLLYLPRILVYHHQALADNDNPGHLRYCLMEKKLHKVIMGPAMAATIIAGIGIFGRFFQPSDALTAPLPYWLAGKLIVVAGLVTFHIWLGRQLKQFANKTPLHSERFYRFANELPAFALAIIVVLVVFRP